MVKQYIYITLGCLGQMYEEDGETEANVIASGTKIVLASDYDALTATLRELKTRLLEFNRGYEIPNSDAELIATIECALGEL
jgi:hypothetical protein